MVSDAYLIRLKTFLQAYPWVVRVSSILGFALLLTWVYYLCYRRMTIFLLKKRHALTNALLGAMYWPFIMAIWGKALLTVLQVAMISPDDTRITSLSRIFVVVLTLTIAFSLLRFIRVAETQLLHSEATHFSRDETSVRAVGRLMRIGVVLVAVLFLLPLLGMNVAGIWAFGGGSAIVLGIAAREIFSNYFGGLMLYVDRTFKIGDWIHVLGRSIEGRVEHIGWRVTQLRTLDQKACYVPNAILSASIVVNTTQAKRSVLQGEFTMRCVDAVVLGNVVQEIRTTLQNHPDIDQDEFVLVHVTAIGMDTAQLDWRAFAKLTDDSAYRDLKQALLFQLIHVIERNGIQHT